MRGKEDESRGEENREQKGLEQREQESSLTLLTVMSPTHTHTLTLTHTNTNTHKLCNTSAIRPPTHTHLMYTGKKKKNLPLYLSATNTHTLWRSLTLTPCARSSVPL